ncbi:MAG: hypothetical protein AAF415_00690 [Pseudomonadota bacterium]
MFFAAFAALIAAMAVMSLVILAARGSLGKNGAPSEQPVRVRVQRPDDGHRLNGDR